MFLARDRKGDREQRVRACLSSDPGVALLLAAVNFEWTVWRAIKFLSQTPNRDLQATKHYSLEHYKRLWKQEVGDVRHAPSLPDIVEDWQGVRDAFNQRNVLAHGKGRATRNMASPHVEVLLESVGHIDDYCLSEGVTLHMRMPIRRRKAPNSKT